MSSSDIIRVHSQEIAPTQRTIGAFEVRLKTDRFRLMSPRDIDGYLEEKRDDGKAVAVVKGLHRFFSIDGHHTLSAITRAWGHRVLYLDLVEDLSDLEPDAFWARMKKEGWYLPSAFGEAITPEDLPSSFDALEDDVFRSIAWLTRKMGAFEDLKTPFQEFEVADFLRTRLVFKPQEDYEYELATLRAFELLRSDAARAHAKKHPKLGFVNADPPKDLPASYYEVLAKARAPRFYRRG